MKGSLNNTAIARYLEQLSVIRADVTYSWSAVQPKEHFKDYLLPCFCSVVIHILLFFIFSLSMFRAPIPIVSNSPSSIWLIPFINSSDIFNKSDVVQNITPDETVEAAISRTAQRGETQQISTTESEINDDFDHSTPADLADTQLIVVKQPLAATVVKSKPQQTKATASETRPAQSPPPSKNLVTPEKEVHADQSGTVSTNIPAPSIIPVNVANPKDKQNIRNTESTQQTTVPENSSVRPGLKTTVAANSNLKPAITATAKKTVTVKQELQYGIMSSKTNGDLKLIVTGTPTPLIAISFLDFPATKWNKPLSRNEARRQSNIVPLTISHENSYDVVVVKSHPGIYTITATTDSSFQQLKFRLVLFEGSARETKKNVEALNESKKLVVKILLPDGIIWDDDNAFTGSLEDSESVTKFNTETGLVWKEYK